MGPLHNQASSSLPTRLLWVRGTDPLSYLKPNHVECVCQAVHAGVLIPCLLGDSSMSPASLCSGTLGSTRPPMPLLVLGNHPHLQEDTDHSQAIRC